MFCTYIILLSVRFPLLHFGKLYRYCENLKITSLKHQLECKFHQKVLYPKTSIILHSYPKKCRYTYIYIPIVKPKITLHKYYIKNTP